MEPREFFIEDWLETYKNKVSCNLGESGYKNFYLKDLVQNLKLNFSDLEKISLSDSPNHGSIELRKEISKLYNNVPIEDILITTGTSEALYLLFQILLNKKSRVSLFKPSFQALYEIPKMIGAKIRFVNAKNKLDLKKIFSKEQDLYIINHPHNPTGLEIDFENLDYSKNILFDEHYRFLDFKKELGATGYKNQKNIFATGSITKCFGVTGLRIGWLIADKEFVKRARSYKDYLTHTVNPISEFLALKILQNWKELILPIKNNILNNIDFFSKNYKKILHLKKFKKPSGGLVGWIELEKSISSEKYTKEILEKADVFLLPGASFEQEGFLRIGFGEENSRFEAGILRWIENFPK